MSQSTLPQPIQLRDGVSRCARYAFGPNKLHLCGPDANSEVFAYLKEGVSDPGLQNIMKGFNTMYPYLKQIADANNIADPFDVRVVEAYWIGNELLEHVPSQQFSRHLREGLRMRARQGAKPFDQLVDKLRHGARMHHSFHVFNAYKRTGHDAQFHDLDSMDACRVSWGKAIHIEGPKITVMAKPLLLDGHHVKLGEAIERTITRRLEDDGTFDELTSGDWITMHWHVPCEVVTEREVGFLERYTQQSISLANTTL